MPIWRLDTNTVTITHFDTDIHYPDKISKLVNWKQTDSCYQKAVLSGAAEKMLRLENCFVGMAREIVFECMVYI
ncbi:hypothetical protein [Ruminococcus sp. 210702-SL.1.03]|uniref:hypothetical protein n=1 Tax=Ruminococcus sp. 210702-SL.1.03 TaxID=2883233 RepID=UPI001D06D317|nr:hypothetical protein [Ruminococcus sp. 210702-SL.1.03]MCB6616179.1 hypothetical protein [Ruminococcus sp. 210702-SL.1.03]